MKDDYLFDALNEISDHHITEAAEYKPKIKVLNFKRAISLVACLAVVAVSAFAVSNYVFPEFTEPSTEFITSGRTTVAATTQSGDVQYAPTVLKWEQRDRGSRFPTAEYGEISYGAFESVIIDKSKIGRLLGEIECRGYDEKSAIRKENAEVYEIMGVDTDYALALTFKEDEDKAFYVYINKALSPLTLGEVAEKFNFSENLTVAEWQEYVSYNSDGQTIVNYTMDDELYNAFIKLIENCGNAEAETSDRKYSEEYFVIYAGILGHTFSFKLTADGYLFLGYGGNTLCFSAGTEAYNSLKSIAETKEAETVTQGIMETMPTTAVTSQGYTVEIPSDYEENESDITVTSPAYIPEGMKTEIQPEIHLFSTAPAKSYNGWETWDFSSCYHQISINGVTYTADTTDRNPVSSEKLGSVLYEFEWEDYRYLKKSEDSFTVVIYEVNGTDKEKAVAVGRKDGLQVWLFSLFCLYT